MGAISGVNNAYNPRYNPYIERTKVKDLSSLTFEQTSVLNEVKSIIAGLGDSAVKVQVTIPQLQENGMTISVMGFMSTGDDGTGDFSIGLDTLERMAIDEKYKREIFNQINELVALEKENIARYSKRSQAMPVQVPIIQMDFWNDNEENDKSFVKKYYSQAMRSYIGKYEMNFSYIN